MFKNMLKRSWLSIARKPSRAVILGLVLFAMANLVLASIIIKGAVDESMAYAKSTLGGTVMLQPDIEKLRQQSDSGGAPTPGAMVQITRPSIYVSTVKDIADSSYVKDYTYSITAQAKASGFTPVETTQPSGLGGMRLGGSTEETALESDISVQGINSYAFISQVEGGTMTLSSGTYFDEKTDDKIIISYDLASSNSLEVGDTVTLQNIHDKKPYELEISGIYDLSEESGFGSSANTIYMNVETAARLMSESDYNEGDYSVSNVRYFMNTAENADAFIAEANQKQPTLGGDNLTLSIDDAAYQEMVGPIESVGSFATTILWVVVVASVAIITLMVTINVKDRRYEMGVLLSLGASKRNVIGQIFTELVVVGTLAFVVSIGTSTLLAKAMGEGLLSSQITASEQQSEDNFGRPGGGGLRIIGGQSNSNAEPIDEIDVNASANDYLILFAVGYGIVALSLILPAWNILKYQPKTILAGKE